MMPFFTIVIIPVILIIVEKYINNSKGIDLTYGVIVFLIFFLHYIVCIMLDSEIKMLVNKKYYKLMQLKQDLDNLEYYKFDSDSTSRDDYMN